MFDNLMPLLVALAALFTGLMAGVYFAFSAFIMASLNQVDADTSAAVMISINKIILRSLFMPLFFGSTLLAGFISIMAAYQWQGSLSLLLISAGNVYLVGMFLCTVVFNVPLNNQLLNSEHNTDDRRAVWKHYLKTWTKWNHVRTGCSLMAFGFYVIYLVIF